MGGLLVLREALFGEVDCIGWDDWLVDDWLVDEGIDEGIG